MAVTIDGLQLFGADESGDAVEAQVDVTSVPSQDSDETLTIALEAVESMTIAGRATGIRLTGESGYSTDPETALSEWVQQFVSIVSPSQGEGWSLTDDERNRTITVVATDCSWMMSAGAPFEARWTLDVERGEGVLDASARNPTSINPFASETLGGTDLGTVREKRTELSIGVETFPIAFADTSETIITPQSGVVRRVTIDGQKAGTTSELRTFDNTMRDTNTGGNTELAYQTGFPGTSHTVVIGDYDSTYNAGSPSILDYSLTLFEGLAL